MTENVGKDKTLKGPDCAAIVTIQSHGQQLH